MSRIPAPTGVPGTEGYENSVADAISTRFNQRVITLSSPPRFQKCRVPDELLLEILGYCEPWALFAAKTVCQKWWNILRDEKLWRAGIEKFADDWAPTSPPRGMSTQRFAFLLFGPDICEVCHKTERMRMAVFWQFPGPNKTCESCQGELVSKKLPCLENKEEDDRYIDYVPGLYLADPIFGPWWKNSYTSEDPRWQTLASKYTSELIEEAKSYWEWYENPDIDFLRRLEDFRKERVELLQARVKATPSFAADSDAVDIIVRLDGLDEFLYSVGACKSVPDSLWAEICTKYLEKSAAIRTKIKEQEEAKRDAEQKEKREQEQQERDIENRRRMREEEDKRLKADIRRHALSPLFQPRSLGIINSLCKSTSGTDSQLVCKIFAALPTDIINASTAEQVIFLFTSTLSPLSKDIRQLRQLPIPVDCRALHKRLGGTRQSGHLLAFKDHWNGSHKGMAGSVSLENGTLVARGDA